MALSYKTAAAAAAAATVAAAGGRRGFFSARPNPRRRRAALPRPRRLLLRQLLVARGTWRSNQGVYLQGAYFGPGAGPHAQRDRRQGANACLRRAGARLAGPRRLLRGRLLVARGTWRSNRGVYELAPREVQAPPYHDGRPGLRSFVKRGVTGHPDGSYIFAPASEHDGAADRALALSPGQRGRNGRSNSAPSQRLLPQRARPTACRRRGSRSREPPRCGAPALRLHRGAADRMVCERAHGAPELRGSSRVASWGHPSRWSAPRAAWGRSPGLNRACTADECKAAPVGEFF